MGYTYDIVSQQKLETLVDSKFDWCAQSWRNTNSLYVIWPAARSIMFMHTVIHPSLAHSQPSTNPFFHSLIQSVTQESSQSLRRVVSHRVVDHVQGIFTRWGHQGNWNWKRGFGVQAMMQTTKSLHSVASFFTPCLAFDFVTRYHLTTICIYKQANSRANNLNIHLTFEQ